MKHSFLNNYKSITIDSEGCVNLLNCNKGFYNEKIKVIEKDYKIFQKKKKHNFFKKKNYRTNFLKII